MNRRATKYPFTKGISNPYNKYGRGIARIKKLMHYKAGRVKQTFKKRYNANKFGKWMSKYK